MTEAFGVILFHTTSAAIRAEKLVWKAGLDGKLIPTPRELSSDCGIALQFTWAQKDRYQAVLDSEHIETAGIFESPE